MDSALLILTLQRHGLEFLHIITVLLGNSEHANKLLFLHLSLNILMTLTADLFLIHYSFHQYVTS